MERIDKKVSITAKFTGNSSIYPLYMEYSGYTIKLKKPDAIWKERIGRNLITRFSVSDGVNRYILALNHETLEWKLETIINE